MRSKNETYKNKDIIIYSRNVYTCLGDTKRGEISNDFTPFCLIYSVYLTESTGI